jgi:hypothetical protein
MEELNLFEKLTRVKAPSDFEQNVMARLSLRRESKFRMRRVLRFSFAGGIAFFLIAFILTNVIFVQKRGQVNFATLEKTVSSSVGKAKKQAIVPPSEVIPITEAVDYSHEVRSLSPEPQTIYILEQVSDTTNAGIKY